jgi:GNAT superfamily N-acetyltransferase
MLHFRPATIDDFEACLDIDHSYKTSRVWQLAVSERGEMKQARFQAVKLPRETAVPYPHAPEELVRRWLACEWFLVGEEDGRILAYITAATEKLTPTAWIYDTAVAPEQRRQGIGSDLLAAAARWAKEQEAAHLMVALPMKNDPAMAFLRKGGFNFCGYNEAAYQTGGIALYFSRKLS